VVTPISTAQLRPRGRSKMGAAPMCTGGRAGDGCRNTDDDRIADLEARLRRDDPRFARGLDQGRPRRPREYRRGRAWLVMALALAAVSDADGAREEARM
jgi:hypothetical protein